MTKTITLTDDQIEGIRHAALDGMRAGAQMVAKARRRRAEHPTAPHDPNDEFAGWFDGGRPDINTEDEANGIAAYEYWAAIYVALGVGPDRDVAEYLRTHPVEDAVVVADANIDRAPNAF